MLVINAVRKFDSRLVEVLRRYTLSMTLAKMDPEHADEIPHEFVKWWSTTTLDFDDALGYAKAVYNLEYKWPWSDDKGAS